jgi:hypothetical protein
MTRNPRCTHSHHTLTLPPPRAHCQRDSARRPLVVDEKEIADNANHASAGVHRRDDVTQREHWRTSHARYSLFPLHADLVDDLICKFESQQTLTLPAFTRTRARPPPTTHPSVERTRALCRLARRCTSVTQAHSAHIQ